ncbi:MAG: MOSC N-terminal beta barrel domain-containing protein, partial [Candidatus Acidiferrales bacterium]
MERIGQLSILRRYPVKSMAGEDLEEARVGFAGMMGDRVFAFIDNRNRS